MRGKNPNDIAAEAWALVAVFGSKFALAHVLPDPYDLLVWGGLALLITFTALAVVTASQRYELHQGPGETSMHPRVESAPEGTRPSPQRLGLLTRPPLVILGAGALAYAWSLWSLPSEWAIGAYEYIGAVFVIAAVLALGALIIAGLVCLWMGATGYTIPIAGLERRIRRG